MDGHRFSPESAETSRIALMATDYVTAGAEAQITEFDGFD